MTWPSPTGRGPLPSLDRVAHFIHDDPPDVGWSEGVRQERGHSLKTFRAQARALFLRVDSASLESLPALRHHRLEPLPLRVADDSRCSQRDVQRTVRTGPRHQRQRDPARRAGLRHRREAGHLVGRERPDRLPRGHRASERDVVVQAERAPGLELGVVESRAATSSTVVPSGPFRTTKPASAPIDARACSRQVLLTSSGVAASDKAAVTSWSLRVESARSAASASARRRSSCSSASPA